MIFSDSARLHSVVLHKVGNKLNDEGIRLSDAPLQTDDLIDELLLKYFFSPFKSNEFYNLYHESDINLNEVYNFVSKIFDKPEDVQEQSVNLARHLYEQSTHPKVRSGEFYVAYFTDCMVNGEVMDGVGLFKSESKETYLKIFPQSKGFHIQSDDGININKLDKGCLIFNAERENGYLVAVVDNLSKGSEAQYWIDNFLHVKEREDDYYHTKNLISLCKSFVTEQLPKEFDVSKADQADLLNKSVKFFKEKDNFDMEEFSNEVMQRPDVIKTFHDFKNQFENERDIHINEDFSISDQAVKKQSRVLKSIIKLDKNFHVYIHGNRQYIRNGYDEEAGLHFYQLFYKEES